MCHRASCGTFRRFDGPLEAPSGAHKEPRHYTRPIKPLTGAQASIIYNRYGLSGSVVDGYNEYDDRFLLAVHGPATWQVRGHIAYALSGATPKTLTYIALPDEPFIHWASVREPKAVVIVEDWFSAEKVREAGLASGVALLGTHMNQQKVTEISTIANLKQVPTFLALDKDAFGKSVKYQARYKEQFKYGLYVWALDKDLKYESCERINNAIKHREYNFSGSNRVQGSV